MTTREIATEYRLAQWAQAMQERVANSESIKEFCRSRGVSKNTYFYWQRRLRENASKQLALKQTETTGSDLPARSFAEIRIAEPAAMPEPKSPSLIYMEIGGARLTIDSTYPTEKLAALLRELARPC